MGKVPLVCGQKEGKKVENLELRLKCVMEMSSLNFYVTLKWDLSQSEFLRIRNIRSLITGE